MWHVDEGALHAYLDGALDEYPAVEARRVREHIETCATCAERLAEERRARDEAHEILELAAPRVEAPTFEELRAYVRASSAPRATFSARLYRLGWAASVVLALGTGWLLRGRQFDPTPASDALRAPAPSLEREVPNGERSSEVAVGGPASDAVAAGTAAALRATPESEAPATASDGPGREPAGVENLPRAEAVAGAPGAFADVVGDRDRAAGVADDLSAPSVLGGAVGPTVAGAVPAGAAAGAPPAEPRALSPARLDNLREVEEPVSGQPAPERRQDSVTRDPQVARRAVSAQRLTSAVTVDPAAAGGGDRPAVEDSTDESTGSLVVPGLEVIAVLPVGEGSTFAGMRAFQRLESGDTLELIHLSGGVEPSSLPRVREGWSELLRPRGSGWIVMRAPLPEASLVELLQRLEAGG